jgi:hypothetical protein
MGFTIEAPPAPSDFSRFALGYFISGRFAVNMWFTPVCANLLHHAFELLFKAALVRDGVIPPGTEVNVFLKKTYRHSLTKLWRDVKTRFPDLGEHDGVIADLVLLCQIGEFPREFASDHF